MTECLVLLLDFRGYIYQLKKNEHTSMRISKIYKKFAVYYNNFLKTPFLINAFLDQRILLVRFHFD